MIINSNCAAIDNDFINHLAEAKISDEDLVELLNIIFKDLKLTVIIHPLLYKNEVMKEYQRVKLLFDKGIINQITLSDIFEDDPEKKKYYFHLIAEFFGYLNDQDLPVTGEDILSYWMKDKSLGEIHSLAMCLITTCGLFLSDDEDAQKLRKYIYRHLCKKVRVYDRSLLIDEHLKKGENQIGRTQHRSLAHVR